MTHTPKRSQENRHAQTEDYGHDAWRLLYIMAELATATSKLREVTPAVSIFGSARLPESSPYYRKAVEIARRLSDAGFSVITGGGPGIMEAANRGALEGGAASIGLNISLPHEQRCNDFQNVDLHFRYFFTRKMMFARFALAHIALPGGFGTLDELTECLTLTQTRKTRRIPLILVGRDFWSGMIDWMRAQLLPLGLISEGDIELMEIFDEPDDVVGAVFDFYKNHDIAPTPEERDTMHYL
ncbi:MAG: TIGR00730 family Rossman fold protein [Burkholderiales bacterium]|jgi:uncharacterized protein (TIGR00730 family)|nr:TIGR00730 family Rossman fold protein [Burkholderiales bacterium]